MLPCKDVEALWLAQADGALAPSDERRLREHVASCGRCAALLRALSTLECDLEEVAETPAEPPAFLKARILARLDEQKPPRRWALPRLFTSRRVLAVSTACLAFFAGLLARELHRVNDWVRHGGGQEVVLEYDSPTARLVTLAGDFNEWGQGRQGVRAEREGDRWLFRLRVKPGRYEYAFVVDGKRWLPDPQAAGIIPDGFGGANSVLYVPHEGAKARSL